MGCRDGDGCGDGDVDGDPLDRAQARFLPLACRGLEWNINSIKDNV